MADAPKEKDLRRWALALLFLTPAFFASNMLTARAVHDDIPPIALAFWRWTVTFAILAPFIGASLWQSRRYILSQWKDFIFLGALGMGVCGAFVYIGADTTTATNIGLIYASSPVMIVILAQWWYGAHMTRLQLLGVPLSLVGVLIIVVRGDWNLLINLDFTRGDLWVLAATTAWAIYSVLLQHRPGKLPPFTRFGAIILGGMIVLLPFHIWEFASGEVPLLAPRTFLTVGFLALVASLLAYQSYAFIQRQLGAGPTSLLMYMVPLYTGVLGYLLLGEAIAMYHLIGACLILPGIYLATRKG